MTLLVALGTIMGVRTVHNRRALGPVRPGVTVIRVTSDHARPCRRTDGNNFAAVRNLSTRPREARRRLWARLFAGPTAATDQ
jgi:hypothetical protein